MLLPIGWQIEIGSTREGLIQHPYGMEPRNAKRSEFLFLLRQQIPNTGFANQAVGRQYTLRYVPTVIFIRCFNQPVFVNRTLKLIPEWRGCLVMPPPGGIDQQPLANVIGSGVVYFRQRCQ